MIVDNYILCYIIFLPQSDATVTVQKVNKNNTITLNKWGKVYPPPT